MHAVPFGSRAALKSLASVSPSYICRHEMLKFLVAPVFISLTDSVAYGNSAWYVGSCTSLSVVPSDADKSIPRFQQEMSNTPGFG